MITQEELEDLPDDPYDAFVAFAELAERKFERNVVPQTMIAEREYVIAIREFVDIFELDFLDLPSVENAGAFAAQFDLFKSKVSGLVLRSKLIRLKQQRSGKGGPSLILQSDSKAPLHFHLKKIRDAIAATPDLSQHKRDAIMRRINDLAKEIDTSRTKWETLAALVIEVADVYNDVEKKVSPLRKAVDALVKRLGKARDEVTSLPAPKERPRIEGPKTQGTSEQSSLDDDIPF